MSDETYNGWSNYPTWNVALWLGNEEGSYNTCLDLARSALGDDHPRVTVADALKDMLEEFSPDLEASVYADLLGWALNSVDWFEVADSFLEQVAETA